MLLPAPKRPPGLTVRLRIIEAAHKGNGPAVLALLGEVKVLDGQEVYEALLSQAIAIMKGRGLSTPPSAE